jgi:CRISPR-associated protein Cmr4
MTATTALLGLFAETSLHPGTGQTFGLIDLPIQREAHTGWPCVYGSAMKGALRARAEDLDPKAAWIVDVFGPDATGGKASEHAGALSVTDARLLLLPVRSLTSFYKWVTCPAILRRYEQDHRRLLGRSPFDPAKLPAPDDGAAFVHQAGGDLFLEEFRFKAQPRQDALKPVIDALAPLIGGEARRGDLERRLAVVSDDMFTHLSRFATAVAAHIKIENERKTVKDGALWYEETLPPDTVLYTGLLAMDSRRAPKKEEGAQATEPPDARQVLGHVAGLFPAGREYLQIGGNETVGMGWCRVAFIPSPVGKEG